MWCETPALLHLVPLDPALCAGVGPMLSNLPWSIALAAKLGLRLERARMGSLGAVVPLQGKPTRTAPLQETVSSQQALGTPASKMGSQV